MTLLRERIIALGGMQAANSYVKVNLSLFGLFPRDWCPTIPPEMILAGNLIYEMSSWTRAIVIPLAIVHSGESERARPGWVQPRRVVHCWQRRQDSERQGFLQAGANLFLAFDGGLENLGADWAQRSCDRKAVKRCEEWMILHSHHSDASALSTRR